MMKHNQYPTRDVLIGKLDGDVVFSLLDRNVFNIAGAITVVLTVDLGLRRSIDGQRQTTLARTLQKIQAIDVSITCACYNLSERKQLWTS